MKTCGECNLCCKLEQVPSIDKPTNTWCQHCVIGTGCSIYQQRPAECAKFRCLWLDDPDMHEFMRPLRAHLYVKEIVGDLARVIVDPDQPYAWQYGIGADIIKYLTRKGFHVILACGKQLNFIPSETREMPRKLVIDWTL